MSMFRQLWLAILISALIALAGSLAASLLNARAYLETQLSMKNRDNAASLALALSEGHAQPEDVVVAVAAQFNSGQYEMIRVVSPEGRLIAERIENRPEHGAPAWFIRLLPIRAEPGQARVTDGWRQVGDIVLMSQGHFAYASLWESALHLGAAILLAGLLGGTLVSLVLLRLRGPMRAVIEQAQAITERRFLTIPEPDVPELKQLAAAMNDTVQRLRQSFEEDAARYEALRREANFDPLTGLANRALFMNQLAAALDSGDSAGGHLAIIRIHDLAGINRRLGREATDTLLRGVGVLLGDEAAKHPDGLAARLNGADFALRLTPESEPDALFARLLEQLVKEFAPYADGRAIVHIGHSAFGPGDGLGALLASIDAAIAGAEAKGIDAVQAAIARPARGALPRSADEWRQTINRALADPDRLRLGERTIRWFAGKGIHREAPLRLRGADGDAWLLGSSVVPVAERLGMVQSLNLAGLDLGLRALEADPALPGLWFGLSASAIEDEAFRGHLLLALEARAEAATRLWLQVPEAGAIHDLAALRALAQALKPLGAHIGLEHFGHHFDRIGALYDIGLDFLKVDASFIQDIAENAGNRAFLAGLCEIAHGIGIKVLAEGIELEADTTDLAKLGFDGACARPKATD